MKRNRKYLFAGFGIMILIVCLSGTAISGDIKTITGKVNENNQIMADDGNIYEVEDNEKGDEVVELVGKQVRATGMIEDTGDMKIIAITSYEVIGE